MPSIPSPYSTLSLSFLSPQTPEPLGESGTLFYRPGPSAVACRTAHKHGEILAPDREAREERNVHLRGQTLLTHARDSDPFPLPPSAEDAGEETTQEEREEGGRRGGQGCVREVAQIVADNERGTDLCPFRRASSRQSSSNPGGREGDEHETPKRSTGPCLLRSREGWPSAPHGRSCSSVCAPGHRVGNVNDLLCPSSPKHENVFSPFAPQQEALASAPSSSACGSGDVHKSQSLEDAAFQRVRLQLLSLQYTEKFDAVNTRLVDRLLQDVVKAVENFQLLMKK
ncbi:hypothetical protein NCLIV_015840 [Neospora caninum Liverpool]|nr:hypothetical protein NCLIV_015840 [Neospora caninum Liverpool]CBZ51792.1 hypothetical protein NCLIV_015840 [Neospora caninum Liverpool]|eukprot:XP_003881825.1 hypothetical protein NCLIV_015840 [Neospora caninum Liverpool]